MTAKVTLRAYYLALRRAMPPETVAAAGKTIFERVLTLSEFRDAPAVLTYVASKDNEVETRPLIERALAEARPVWVPVAGAGGALAWSRLRALDELAPGRFGILEPEPAARRIGPPPQDAVCLVPGIAFSPTGYRIGYGGGYFDRFLAGFGGVAVGLAYERQLAPDWRPEPHDRRVDILVTEARVVYLGNTRAGTN